MTCHELQYHLENICKIQTLQISATILKYDEILQTFLQEKSETSDTNFAQKYNVNNLYLHDFNFSYIKKILEDHKDLSQSFVRTQKLNLPESNTLMIVI